MTAPQSDRPNELSHRRLRIFPPDAQRPDRPGTARAVGYNPFMPSHPHIEEYRAKLQELIEFGGSDNEENIRPSVPELPGCLLP